MKSKLSIFAAFAYMVFQAVYSVVDLDNYAYAYAAWWIVNGSYLPYILLSNHNNRFDRLLIKIVAVFIAIQSTFAAIDSILSLSNTLYTIIVTTYILTSLIICKNGSRAK